MKKKILIGSIIAVALLTLVSFSSVVGFQSVKSDSKIASPLFRVKNNKGEISSNYIGKGKAINILLPKRNDKIELVEKFVNRIKMMDEKSLDRFSDILYNQLNDEIKGNINKENIRDSIYCISENSELSKNYLLNGNENSISGNLTFDDDSILECIWHLIVTYLLMVYVIVFFSIYGFILRLLGIELLS